MLWITHARRRIGVLVLVLLAATACAQTEDNDMNQDRIAALSVMTGAQYLAERTAFLKEEARLPDYPFTLDEADPRYRVQYLILQGWQNNTALYQSLEDELAAVKTTFMSISASGFDPLYNDIRKRARETWKYDGLAYSWEMILKRYQSEPEWKVQVGFEILDGFYHADSIDALLVAGTNTGADASFEATVRAYLRNAPVQDLDARTKLTQQFYVLTRPALSAATQGR